MKGNEISSTVFAHTMNTNYLPEKDKYLYAKEPPRYRFNVLGSGMIAQEHIRVTLLEGRGDIHGIYDPNSVSVRYTTETFSQRYPDHEPLTVYDSLEAACNDPTVDALLICSPNYTHIQVAREAIKSGKPIFMEKPMVTNIEDALEMLEIAKNYKNIFQIGLQYRYKAIYTEAREAILEQKSLGDVHTISILEHRIPFLDKVDQWNKFSQYSGGTLVEKCCHYFDLFNLFAQSKPKSVYAIGGQAVNFTNFEYDGKKSDILDHAMVVIEYENGVQCNFNLCMFAPMFREELVVCGTKGRLYAYENEDYLPDHRKQTHLEILTGDHGPSRISRPCYPSPIQSSGHMGATFFEHKYFIDAIDGNPRNTATIEEGFWSVVVGIAAEQSAKTGKIIQISDLVK